MYRTSFKIYRDYMNGNTVVGNKEQEGTVILCNCVENRENGYSLSRDYEENEEQKQTLTI